MQPAAKGLALFRSFAVSGKASDIQVILEDPGEDFGLASSCCGLLPVKQLQIIQTQLTQQQQNKHKVTAVLSQLEGAKNQSKRRAIIVEFTLSV